MTILQIQQYITVSNIILACILSLALYKSKTKGNKWLSLLLLLYSTFSVLRLGYLQGSRLILIPLSVIILPSIYFIGATILFYTNSVLFDEQKQKIFKFLIIPLLFGIAHFLLIIILPDQMTVQQIKNQTGIHKLYLLIHSITLMVYSFITLGMSYIKIINYKKAFKANFSNDMMKNINWLVFFLFLNILIFAAMAVIAVYFLIQDKGVPFTIAGEIVVLLIYLVLIYYLISKPEVLPVESKKNYEKKYQKINLPENIRKEYAQKLENYMNDKQAYLNEKISVYFLAKELNIPQHHLSITINMEFGKNFYNYINQQRIKYAERLLKDSEDPESILVIAYNSGFQSKTTLCNCRKFATRQIHSIIKYYYIIDIAK